MNQAMWSKAVTQENIEKIQRHGVMVIGPEQGDQACGETALAGCPSLWIFAGIWLKRWKIRTGQQRSA